MNRFIQKSHHLLSEHYRECMCYFLMFDLLFAKLDRQDQGRGPNQECVKITFNLPLVKAPVNALHLRK